MDSLLADALSSSRGIAIPASPRLMQRGVADLLERHVVKRLVDHVELSRPDAEAVPARTKKSIEDVLVRLGGTAFYVDVKTRDSDGTFSMPNLISIDRLDKLYRKPTNVMKLVMVDYRREGGTVVIEDLRWHSIEEICWSSLAIQNIGLGQLQIKNAKKCLPTYRGDRRAWIRDLHGAGVDFYGRMARKACAARSEWEAKHRGLDMRVLRSAA